MSAVRTYSEQTASAGTSMQEIVMGALVASRPARGLSWLDIGCGRGDLLRTVRDEWEPASLYGIDPIDWLEEDLREDVNFFVTTGGASRRAVASG